MSVCWLVGYRPRGHAAVVSLGHSRLSHDPPLYDCRRTIKGTNLMDANRSPLWRPRLPEALVPQQTGLPSGRKAHVCEVTAADGHEPPALRR